MLNKLRVRTFAKFIAEYGEEKLMNALESNKNKGVIYHYARQPVGDYDKLDSGKEITEMLLHGK